MSLSLRSTLFCLALALAACGTDIRLQPGLVDAGSDAQTASEPTSNGGAQDGGDQAEVDGASPITPDASRSPCDDSCSGDTPYCDVASDTCVACNTSADCKDPQNSLCNAESKCEPCQGHGDCAHLPNTPLCHQQQCVACLPGARDTCGNNVCDMVSQDVPVCAQGKAPRSATTCQPCVSDEQCQDGQLCVPQRWDSDDNGSKETLVGWFCQWKKVSDGAAPLLCDSGVRPFIGEEALPSADAPGKTQSVCTLALSTCLAHQVFRSACGRGPGDVLVENRTRDALGNTISPAFAAEDIHPDNSVCGLGGRCVVLNQTDGAYRCSVPCGGSAGDCPTGGFTCGGNPPNVPGVCGI